MLELKLIYISKRFPCAFVETLQSTNQPVWFISGYTQTLASFLVDASDQELLQGQEYSSLTSKRSCGQFLGNPAADVPNELLCSPGAVGRYVYMQSFGGHPFWFMIAEFEVYPRRE